MQLSRAVVESVDPLSFSAKLKLRSGAETGDLVVSLSPHPRHKRHPHTIDADNDHQHVGRDRYLGAYRVCGPAINTMSVEWSSASGLPEVPTSQGPM